MIRRPPRSTHCISSAASDVYKRQGGEGEGEGGRRGEGGGGGGGGGLSLIHISEPTRPLYISYAVFCLKKQTTGRDRAYSGGRSGMRDAHAFFNDTGATEIYTLHIVGSVRCV